MGTDRKDGIDTQSGWEKEYVELIERMPMVEFINQHGEKFEVRSNGLSVYLSGNEVDAMVAEHHKIGGKYVQLFNPSFSVWSKDELISLGKALILVNGGEVTFGG